jgi:hypothetical protein
LQHQLEEDEDLIAYKDKKNSALYPAFLPNGRSEYTQATLLTAELLLSRAATLGPDFDATRYTAFLAAFVAARSGTGAGDEPRRRRTASARPAPAPRASLTSASNYCKPPCLTPGARRRVAPGRPKQQRPNSRPNPGVLLSL